jgi:hypothetical protein
MDPVSQLLDDIDKGDPQAAGRLLPLVYDELRRLAAAKLAQEKPGQTLDAAAEPLLKDGYQGMKERDDKIPAVVRQLGLTEALARLVALYEATGKREEAARWRKQLDAVKVPPTGHP